MKRIGTYTIKTQGNNSLISTGSAVGKTESEGPLKDEFDYIYTSEGMNSPSWEQAESVLHQKAIELALFKAGLKSEDINIHFAGDLLNQCSASSFAEAKLGIPFAGIYGACSTMALSLALASVFADSGIAEYALASTSSHFCSAEKQFRFPLEYGNQRPPTAQRTATASGAVIVKNDKTGKVYTDAVLFGKVCDLGVTDSANMGAAMAPENDRIGPYRIGVCMVFSTNF